MYKILKKILIHFEHSKVEASILLTKPIAFRNFFDLACKFVAVYSHIELDSKISIYVRSLSTTGSLNTNQFHVFKSGAAIKLTNHAILCLACYREKVSRADHKIAFDTHTITAR